jgi:hypothetical protein
MQAQSRPETGSYQMVCRVQFFEHSAKEFFAECKKIKLGKKKKHLAKPLLCRVSKKYSAERSLPSVFLH